MKLVVSLHDVSPLTRDVFAAMLDELRGIGVGRCSLLVVPNHHHRGHFHMDARFCRWLERLAAEGHELVIHGYYHQRSRRAGENLRQRLMTRVYTADEGEFYDLPKAEAAALLARAREEFARLDAPAPEGFIAPAWLLGTGAAEAVREAGFRYTTRLGSLEDFAANATVASQSLVYSCRNAWRRAVSLAWNASLARRLRENSLLRLSLHAPDYRRPRIWRQALRLAREAMQTREVVTYADFVSKQPLAAPGR
jgi:predicted deacetylase